MPALLTTTSGTPCAATTSSESLRMPASSETSTANACPPTSAAVAAPIPAARTRDQHQLPAGLAVGSRAGQGRATPAPRTRSTSSVIIRASTGPCVSGAQCPDATRRRHSCGTQRSRSDAIPGRT